MSGLPVVRGEVEHLGKAKRDGRRSGCQGRRPRQFYCAWERATHASLFVFTQQNRFLRRRYAAPAVALTATAPPVSLTMFSIVRAMFEEAVMAHELIENTVFETLVSGLEVEFGTSEIGGLALRYIDAEAADFHWDARISERHLGAYLSPDDDGSELERVGVIGVLAGRFYVATCVVDGDGGIQTMLDCKYVSSAGDAQKAFEDAG